MRKLIFLLTLFIAISFYSCKKEKLQADLYLYEDSSYRGTFKTINSENISGTVILNISNGYYECLTNLPFGHGAGKLEIKETKINFIDTLFLPIPAIYGPSYVISGEHFYTFDGENLKMWREKNVGSVQYDLQIERKD